MHRLQSQDVHFVHDVISHEKGDFTYFADPEGNVMGIASEGLRRFERTRRDRTGAMLLASRLQGRIYGRADPEFYATTPRPAADPRIVGPYDPVTVAI